MRPSARQRRCRYFGITFTNPSATSLLAYDHVQTPRSLTISGGTIAPANASMEVQIIPKYLQAINSEVWFDSRSPATPRYLGSVFGFLGTTQLYGLFNMNYNIGAPRHVLDYWNGSTYPGGQPSDNTTVTGNLFRDHHRKGKHSNRFYDNGTKILLAWNTNWTAATGKRTAVRLNSTGGTSSLRAFFMANCDRGERGRHRARTQDRRRR